MKNLSVVVVVTALIAFLLGYVTRGNVEQSQDGSKNRMQSTISESANPTEDPNTQLRNSERAETRDIDTQSAEIPNPKPVLTSTSSTPREVYAASKRRRLGDFFTINGISADRADQIVQELIDADHYVVQKQNSMIERHIAENAESIAQGLEVGINLTPEESAELQSDRESLYRKIFGEYYEAHEEYDRSYTQRLVVRALSSKLPEPLDYTTGETMVQIMHEENSRLQSDVMNTVAQSSGASNREVSRERLEAKRSYNKRVLERAKPYLSSSQFDELESLLDNDIRRNELAIEIVELEEANLSHGPSSSDHE